MKTQLSAYAKKTLAVLAALMAVSVLALLPATPLQANPPDEDNNGDASDTGTSVDATACTTGEAEITAAERKRLAELEQRQALLKRIVCSTKQFVEIPLVTGALGFGGAAMIVWGFLGLLARFLPGGAKEKVGSKEPWKIIILGGVVIIPTLILIPLMESFLPELQSGLELIKNLIPGID